MHEGDKIIIDKISGFHNKIWTGVEGVIIKVYPTGYKVKAVDKKTLKSRSILLFKGEFKIIK